MNRRTKALISAGVLAAAGIGGGIAAASGGDDDANEPPDRPIAGNALDRASVATLDHLGEGWVTETEVGDEESYYEVEVTLDDGSQVDVQLDSEFNVVGQSTDDAGDQEGGADD
ncbi:MAG: hypothetical protein WD646_14560 [Actinomycetota bacterium]